jgi:hypothetical protein
MIALLKHLDGHEDKTEQEATDEVQSGFHLDTMFNTASRSATQVVIDALNDERSPHAMRIYKELVTCLWDQKRIPRQREWVEGGSDDKNSAPATVQQFRNYPRTRRSHSKGF